MPSIGIGIARKIGARVGITLPLGTPSFVAAWINLGVWDDRIPTSAAWDGYLRWLIGAWDDGLPTAATSWSAPTGDSAVWTIWDDMETTA